MAIYDFRRIDGDTPLSADVCIVGSGPAGWTLADELRASGLSVVVIESGGALESAREQYDASVEALNTTVDTGHPLFNGRRRTLGGTTEVAGWANRTIALDPIDFEARDWVPYSGWPFAEEAIKPFLDRAAKQLGVGAAVLDAPRLPRRSNWPALDPMQLSAATWSFGQGEDRQVMRYGRLFRRRAHEHVTVLVHATVTQVLTNAEGTRAEGVEIASPDGKRASVTAHAVVLAAGGIENPRILLYSNQSVSVGLGNREGLVGRFLMDHPRDLDMALTFDLSAVDRLRGMFGPFRLDCGFGLRYVTNGLALSAARQRRDSLINCAAWFIEETADDDPVDAAKRLVRRHGDLRADAKAVAKNAALLLRTAHGRLLGSHALYKKPRKIGLVIGSEQTPDPESRVSLADSVDRFGLPLARTHWRINEIDRISQVALATTIESEFRRLALPRAIVAKWAEHGSMQAAQLVDGCHPTGTTRMSDDPKFGVVDANCEVHGVKGLYVAGSSVFPTNGHANPTLMIAALSARLADHIAGSLAGHAQPVLSASTSRPVREDKVSGARDLMPSAWTGKTVAITGASGFLGGRLVARLVEEGARVVCLTRRSANRSPLKQQIEERVVDLADQQALTEATSDVDYLFHCAYDWADEDWNRRAMATLIVAARAGQWKQFVHVSSFVVYDLPPEGRLNEAMIETTAPWGYARTKAELEAMLLAAVDGGELMATIIQPTLIYGPGSQPWTIDPLDKLTYGTVVLPDADQGVCNAVFVEDVVNAMMLSAQAPASSGQRFLVSGNPVSWSAFYEGLAAVAGVRGPLYLPRDVILRKNRTIARLVHGLFTARLLARKVANFGPVRRMAAKALPFLPKRLQGDLQTQLYGPITRLRGHTHLPDAGELEFLESRATIGSDKARQIIGYSPSFDLDAGMAITGACIRGI